MFKKILFLFIFFYFLVLLETSFLSHFPILQRFPFFIFLSLIFLVFFEKSKENLAVISSSFAGFFWDIFSERPIGFHILILLIFVILLKLILQKYVRVRVQKRI